MTEDSLYSTYMCAHARILMRTHCYDIVGNCRQLWRWVVVLKCVCVREREGEHTAAIFWQREGRFKCICWLRTSLCSLLIKFFFCLVNLM